MKDNRFIRIGLFIGAIVVGGLWTWPKVALQMDKIGLDIKSEFTEGEVAGIFNNKNIVVPNDKIKNILEDRVLAQEEKVIKKRIEVDLSSQKLLAYENDKKVFEYLISSGTWNRTPTGEFKIWSKIKSQKMSGGSREMGTYFYLPNVPNILFFYNDKTAKQLGYSIHGAYWHNQFGKPMSHGCINMTPEESKTVFDWAEMDTPIIIYGKMPIISLPRAER